MDDLEKLIRFIQENYNEINKKWLKDEQYIPLNMKKNTVDTLYNNENLLLYVFNYRSFINEYSTDLMNNIKELNLNSSVSSRVKALNSIQYKIENYKKTHENGKIPIKKCLNDLLGIRIIIEEELEYDVVNKFIREKFSNLKCILSNKGDYKAIHIYFGNDDNKKFQWELQLWNMKNTKGNYESHAKYKQDYTKWESENKYMEEV